MEATSSSSSSSSVKIKIKKESCPVCSFEEGDNGLSLEEHLISHSKSDLVLTLLHLQSKPKQLIVGHAILPDLNVDSNEEKEQGEEEEDEEIDEHDIEGIELKDPTTTTTTNIHHHYPHHHHHQKQQQHIVNVIETPVITTTSSDNDDEVQTEFHRPQPPPHNNNNSSGSTTTTVQVVVLSGPSNDTNNDVSASSIETIHNPISTKFSDTGKNYNVKVIFTTKGNHGVSDSPIPHEKQPPHQHHLNHQQQQHQNNSSSPSKKVSRTSSTHKNNNFNSPNNQSSSSSSHHNHPHSSHHHNMESNQKAKIIRDFTKSPTPNESTFTVLQPSPYYIRNEESPYKLHDMSSLASHRIHNEFLPVTTTTSTTTPHTEPIPPPPPPPPSQNRMESTDEQEAINRSMYLSAIQLLSAGGSVPSSSLIDNDMLSVAVGSQRMLKAKVSGGKIEIDNDISNYLDVDLMTDEEMPGKGEISEFEESNTSFGSRDSSIRADILKPSAERPVSFSFGTDEDDTRNKHSNTKSLLPAASPIAESSSSTAEKFICFDECQNHKSPKRFSSLFEMIQHKSGGHKGSAFASILNSHLEELADQAMPRVILDVSGVEGESSEPVSAPVPLQIKTYFCVYCEFTSRSKKLLNNHLTTDHPGRPINPDVFECSTCGKIFRNRSSLRKHLLIHREKSFVCTTCSKGFSSRFKLMEHTRVHTGIYPFKCGQCGKSYRTPSLLSTHEKQVHSTAPPPKKIELMCGICHRILHSKRNLEQHMLTHDQKPEKCVHCGETFPRRAVLVRHIRASHDSRYTSVKTKECSICGKVLHPNSIKSHMLIHKQEKPHTCLVCHKKFRTLGNLHNHAWSHTNIERPYKCSLCPKSYIFLKSLQNHTIVHKRKTLHFVCNECGVKFTNKSNLKRHVEEHTAEKKFKCLICGKKFFRHYYLIEHVRIHSGSRPFTCSICGKSSATKSNHAAHVKIHDARESGSLEN